VASSHLLEHRPAQLTKLSATTVLWVPGDRESPMASCDSFSVLEGSNLYQSVYLLGMTIDNYTVLNGSNKLTAFFFELPSSSLQAADAAEPSLTGPPEVTWVQQLPHPRG